MTWENVFSGGECRYVEFCCGLTDIMRRGGFVISRGGVFGAWYSKAWYLSAAVWRLGGADGIE